MEGYLMERDSPIEPFGFAMDVLSSTRKLTSVKKSAVNAFATYTESLIHQS